MKRTIIFVVIVWMIFFIALIWNVEVFGYEYTPEDVVRIGMVVNHEALNESELGQRLVIDTILNRVEDDAFPNTVKEVLEQPGQYCKPTRYPPKEVYHIIVDEIYNRTNVQVLWYRTKKYHTYGVPLLREGNHYFSGGM